MPSPTTLIFAAFCRANCSTPGASRLHADQWGAQNQTNNGFFPSNEAASATSFPVFTSVTFMTGSGLTDFFEVADLTAGLFGAAPAIPPVPAAMTVVTTATSPSLARALRQRLGDRFNGLLLVEKPLSGSAPHRAITIRRV